MSFVSFATRFPCYSILLVSSEGQLDSKGGLVLQFGFRFGWYLETTHILRYERTPSMCNFDNLLNFKLSANVTPTDKLLRKHTTNTMAWTDIQADGRMDGQPPNGHDYVCPSIHPAAAYDDSPPPPF